MRITDLKAGLTLDGGEQCLMDFMEFLKSFQIKHKQMQFTNTETITESNTDADSKKKQ